MNTKSQLKKTPMISYANMRLNVKNLAANGNDFSVEFQRNAGKLQMAFTKWLLQEKQFVGIKRGELIH